MSLLDDSQRPSETPVVVVGAGQSGLAAARALHEQEVPTVVLEAGDRPAGSWPHYYDSLRLFSPAAYSSMPGRSFRGDPDRYPTRDEVADYLGQLRRHAPGRYPDQHPGSDRPSGRPRVRGHDRPMDGSSQRRGSSPRAARSRTPTGPSSRARTASAARCCTWPSTATRCRMPGCG